MSNPWAYLGEYTCSSSRFWVLTPPQEANNVAHKMMIISFKKVIFQPLIDTKLEKCEKKCKKILENVCSLKKCLIFASRIERVTPIQTPFGV
jgi:hypothetical protein